MSEATAKKKRSPGKTVLIVCLCIVAFIAAVLLGGRLYFRLPVRDYYAASVPAFAIPGLGEGFVPQGLALDEEAGVFLVGGYRTGSGNASPVYAVDRATGEVKAHATLAYADGRPYTGHCGGMSVWRDKVLVAGSDKPGQGGVCVFDRDAVLAAKNGEPVRMLGCLDTPLTAEDSLGIAFVCVDGDELTVGEYYHAGAYPTPDSHKYTAPSGDYLQALAVTYRIGEGGSITPLRAYCLPDEAQGLTVRGGKIWVSTSWAVGFSHICAYDLTEAQPFDTLSVDGTEVPLYALDSSVRAADYRIPPMSEEIVFAGFEERPAATATDEGETVTAVRLVTMCESACRKYWFGLLTGGQWCYATDLTLMTSEK